MHCDKSFISQKNDNPDKELFSTGLASRRIDRDSSSEGSQGHFRTPKGQDSLTVGWQRLRWMLGGGISSAQDPAERTGRPMAAGSS
jgi:hypothetical protein